MLFRKWLTVSALFVNEKRKLKFNVGKIDYIPNMQSIEQGT